MKAYTFKMASVSIIAIFIIIINFSFPELSLRGAISGLKLCGSVIIPSLFPFCVIALFCYKSGVVSFLSKILSPLTEKVFHLSGEQFCIFLISFLAGYPVGMRLIKELADENKISKNTAANMGLYCINAGPAFIIVAIGSGLLGDTLYGVYLFIANAVATFVLLFIAERKSVPQKSRYFRQNIAISDAFVESAADASSAVIGICGWVILFSSLLALLDNPIFPPIISKTAAALCEVTTATIAAKKYLPLIAAIISFGGFCVHCQFYSVGKQYAPKYAKFLAFRLIHAAISSVITYLLQKCDTRTIDTITNNVTIVRDNTTFSYASAIALIFMCCVLLSSIHTKKEKLR